MKKIDHGQDLRGIGKRIRQVRNLVEFSQVKMARLVGISNQSTYGNYEAGRSVPVDFAIHFSEVCRKQLGVHFTLDWLLNGEGTGPEIKQGRGVYAKPGAMTSAAGSLAELPQIESSPLESNNIDLKISEQIQTSIEVLKELIHKKYEAQQPLEGDTHPYLREVPFAIIDMMSVIRYASPGACKLFKTSPEAAVGHSTMRFGREAFDKAVPVQIKTMLEEGCCIERIRANTSQFEPLDLVMIQWLIRDKDGNPCMASFFVPTSEIADARKEVAGLEVEKIKSHVAWERDQCTG